MKFRFGKHDFFGFGLLFLLITLPLGLFTYFNDWYTVLKWSVGLLIFIYFLITSTEYILFVNTQKRINIDTIINFFKTLLLIILIAVPLILYVFMISYFENSELRNYGKETVGFIYDYGNTKHSRYHKVYFMDIENKRYKSEILGKYEFYKLGDTVRVIYSERIPEINRAD